MHATTMNWNFFIFIQHILKSNLVFFCQGKQSISLEPGGQFELSGAPLETLHQTCAEVNSHLYQVNKVLFRNLFLFAAENILQVNSVLFTFAHEMHRSRLLQRRWGLGS